MTHRAEHLQKINALLEGASDDTLAHVMEVLEAATQVARFVGLDDLLEYIQQERLGVHNLKDARPVWRYLLEINDATLRVCHAGTLMKRSPQETGRVSDNKAWVIEVESLQAFVRSLLPIAGEPASPHPVSSLTSSQKTLLIGWAGSL